MSAQVCKGVIQPRAATSGAGQEVEDRFVGITHPLHALYELNDVSLLVPMLLTQTLPEPQHLLVSILLILPYPNPPALMNNR